MQKWYLVSVWGGTESSVKAELERKVKILKCQDKVSKVLIPVRKFDAIKRNKKVLVNERLYGGVLLILMDMSPESFALVRTTSNVVGFFGVIKEKKEEDIQPIKSVTLEEVDDILMNMRYIKPDEGPLMVFSPGEKVRAKQGPLAGFTGIVEKANGRKVKVCFEIFKRETIIDLDAELLEKEILYGRS